MRLGNVFRSLALLSLAAISVLAIVALLALRLGVIAPAEARTAATASDSHRAGQDSPKHDTGLPDHGRLARI